MSIILFIVIGGIIGWLASAIMGRGEGVLASIIIGIIGALIGGFLSTLFTGGSTSYMTLTLGGILWSLIGSIILVAILNAFTRTRHTAS